MVLERLPGVRLSAEQLIALRRVSLSARAAPVLANLPGGFASRRRGQGQEVADLRPYVHGDDLRHLDRGTTARTGIPHVRRFQEDRDRLSLLVADMRAPMLWGITRALCSIAAAEALALLGWQVVEDGGRVGLLAITDAGPVIVPPRGRTRGMLDVIGGLVRAHRAALTQALTDLGTTLPFDDALAPLDRLAPKGCEVVIASGFDAAGEGLDDLFAQLDRRRALLLLAISDGDGTLPPGDYPIRMADGRQMRVTLGRATAPPPTVDIAGRAALSLDAGLPLETMARVLAGALRTPAGTNPRGGLR